MKALLIHLSDIHVRDHQDPVLSRAEQVSAAVQNLDYELDAAVIAVSGDLAYSGGELQYLAVWDFLRRIKTQLEETLSPRVWGAKVPVSVVAIPGNHDCDFSSPDRVRDLVLPSLLLDGRGAMDATVVETCTRVQKPFFDALDANATGGLGVAATAYDQRLCYLYPVPVGDKTLSLLCLNTAWLSQKHERQGELYLPADIVPEVLAEADVVVTMLHHPYNWLDSNAARALRKRIEAEADIVLTGHEHDATMRTQQLSTGERNTYVEGGALQTSDGPHHSVFNAFVLDLTRRKQKMLRMSWDGSRYCPLGIRQGAGDESGPPWEDLQVARLRSRGQFHLDESTHEFLDDPGVNLLLPDRTAPRLREVFVFPDLQEATYDSERNGDVIRGAGLIDLVINAPRLLLLGGAQSGKTALAKMLYRHLHEGGYVPVYLDRTSHLPGGQVDAERMHAHLAGVFAKQYDSSARQAYEQLDRSRRVVIVDDYHQLQRNRKVRAAFMDALTRVAGKVILLANHVAMEANELLDPGSRVEAMDFEAYSILPFGHARRGELINRWLLLGGRAHGDAGELAQRREVLTRTINDFIGRSWLPPYPVYILSLLQLRDDLTPSDTRIDSHGAYYELFIRNTLASVLTPKESAFVLTYLAHLAYQFLVDGVEEVDVAKFNRIHRMYEQRFEIEPEVARTRDKLIECGVLHRSGDAIRFRYPYIFYYFVALWIRDHIGEQDIRAKIAELSRSLYVQEHADILLFLAHLSKDRVIVDELLTAARAFYPDVQAAEFAEDVKFLSRLGPATGELVYQEHDIDEERARHLAEMDEHEAEARERGDNGGVRNGQPSDAVSGFTTALITVQILGQVLRNHPGDLEGDVKLDIARECCSLGLRGLASLYSVFHRHEADILADAAVAVREQSPEITDPRKIEENAQRMLVASAEFLGYAVVRSIAAAIGASELELTYDRLVTLDKAPAVRLIRMSIDIDHSGEFPQLAVKNLARDLNLRDASFAHQILKLLVVSYFYMFPVPVKVKQSVCSTLDIKYAALVGADPSRKMLN